MTKEIHRTVFLAAYDKPPWRCHFCGGAITRKSGPPPVRENLAVHHLDGDRKNNVLENLAAAHRSCHQAWHASQPRVQRRNPEDEPRAEETLILYSELPRLFGVTRARVGVLARREDFPKPAQYTAYGQPLWLVKDVELWRGTDRKRAAPRQRCAVCSRAVPSSRVGERWARCDRCEARYAALEKD